MIREGSAQEAGFFDDRIELIKERAQDWIAPGRTQSLVLLAARRGVVALHEAFGVAGYDRSGPLKVDTIFATASLTKPVTATAVMMLAERGEISLNAPLKNYFPELSAKNTELILVHQLLTHTSGYIDRFADGPPEATTPLPPGQDPLFHPWLERLLTEEPLKTPGERNIYASCNYGLLGELVRRVSGQRLDDYAREHIFEPLGMRATTIGAQHRQDDRLLPLDPTLHRDETHLGMAQRARDSANGAGSLCSNAEDLAIFGECFRRGGEYGGVRILNEWTVKEMTRNQIPGIGAYNWRLWIKEASWGLGWMVQGDARWRESHGMLQPRGTFYHTGGTGTGLWIDPVHDVVAVYLSMAPLNFDTGEANWDFDKYQNMVTAAIDHSR